MKIILLLSIFVLQLLANNPKVYAVLGDKLYNNVDAITKLQEVSIFSTYKNKINTYTHHVKSVKEVGFMIDKNRSNTSKKEYLKKLRELSVTNDFFIDLVNSYMEKSMSEEDNILYLEMANSRLINVQKYKKQIKKYYYAHKSELNIKGTFVQTLIDEDLKNKKPLYIGPTKEELEKAKINRIRAKDKAKQEAISRSIEEELTKKKLKIREEQKSELRTK